MKHGIVVYKLTARVSEVIVDLQMDFDVND